LFSAPITSNKKKYPTRVKLKSDSANGMIVLDQIRTIDKQRIVKSLGQVTTKTRMQIKEVLNEMLVR